jgi:flagellar basal body-associated protein FliL
MKYSLSRKINLGKFGLQYEALDFGVSDCDTFEEAKKEMAEIKSQILKAFAPDAEKRLKTINSKQALTASEQQERAELLNLNSPF